MNACLHGVGILCDDINAFMDKEYVCSGGSKEIATKTFYRYVKIGL